MKLLLSLIAFVFLIGCGDGDEWIRRFDIDKMSTREGELFYVVVDNAAHTTISLLPPGGESIFLCDGTPNQYMRDRGYSTLDSAKLVLKMFIKNERKYR